MDRGLGKILLHATADTWHEAATRLNKELHWEFDGYTQAVDEAGDTDGSQCADEGVHRTPFETDVTGASPLISYVLSAHLWLEHPLDQCLRIALPNPDAMFRGRALSFPTLVALAEAHSILEADFAEVLLRVNALRNKFAIVSPSTRQAMRLKGTPARVARDDVAFPGVVCTCLTARDGNSYRVDLRVSREAGA